MSSELFQKALKSFTMDAAAGDAIRHLAGKGFTPVQIRDALSFPAPMDYIISVMWDYLLKSRKVLLTDPAAASGPSSDSEIVEHRDKYGRKSFLSVKKSPGEVIFSPEDYHVSDFGIRKAGGEEFGNGLSLLPWPPEPVWVLNGLFDDKDCS